MKKLLWLFLLVAPLGAQINPTLVPVPTTASLPATCSGNQAYPGRPLLLRPRPALEQTVTVTGVATTQAVRVNAPAFLGTHLWIGGARASAANTVAVDFCADATAGTPPSGTWLFIAQ
jgi:hypothetical protein